MFEVEPGSLWEHYNGNRYVVVAIANQLDTEKYPKTVVHQNVENDTIWARPLSDWHRSYHRVFLNEAHNSTDEDRYGALGQG